MAATAFWMLTSSGAPREPAPAHQPGTPHGSVPAAEPGAERGVQPRHLELETTLVVRRSTAPPR